MPTETNPQPDNQPQPQGQSQPGQDQVQDTGGRVIERTERVTERPAPAQPQEPAE